MTCKNCYHYEKCYFDALEKSHLTGNDYREVVCIDNHIICKFFKDKSRIVELPCLIGDKVYFPYTGENYPQKLVLLKLNIVNVGKVVSFTTDGYGAHIRVQFRENGCTERTFYADEINKKVFFDKAKAEAKLKELNNGTT